MIQILRVVGIAVFLISVVNLTFAQQLQEVVVQGGAYEATVYDDEHGNLYSKTFFLWFDENVIDVDAGTKYVGVNDLDQSYSDVIDALETIDRWHGPLVIERVAPHLIWGDTDFTNIRTGKTVTIPDYSQNVIVHLDTPAEFDWTMSQFDGLHEVKYFSPPGIVLFTNINEPNDPAFVNGHQWELDVIRARQAWGISRGLMPSRPVGIAVSDWFDCNFINDLHYDLQAQLIYVDHCYDPSHTNGGHGISVAGYAGATTDNGTGIASLGWNTHLYGFQHGKDGLSRIVSYITQDEAQAPHGAIDIVNTSWAGGSSEIRDHIRTLLTLGVVVVAGAGNGQGCSSNGVCQFPVFPAAYYFDDIDDGEGGTFAAQVIAVSGTREDDTFEDAWTYSVGEDPINDPINSYIDVAAPGVRVIGLKSSYDSTGAVVHGTGNVWGTSVSSPIVAALASLIIGVNPDLRVDKYYEIITQSADKVDEDRYPDTFFWYDEETAHEFGWNQYTGYGRINAWRALIYTLERFGGVAGGPGFVFDIVDPEYWWFHRFDDVTFTDGTDVTIVPGTMVRVGKDRRVNIQGNFAADDVEFTVRPSVIGAPGEVLAWKGLTFFPGSAGSISNSSLVSIHGGVADAGLRSIGASVIISDTELSSTAGSGGVYAPLIYSTGMAPHDGVQLVRTTVNSNAGPSVYAHAYGAVRVHDSALEVAPISLFTQALVQADGAQATVEFWDPGSANAGLNELYLGRLLSRGSSAVINAGDANGSKSHNHFCDADSAVLEVDDGGTIYARYNFWPAGGPTSISGTGSIFYSNNLGLAQCDPGRLWTGEGPGLIATYPERSGSSAGAGTAIRDAGRSSSGDQAALFEAKGLATAGQFAQARQILRDLVEAQGPVARPALMELGRVLPHAPHPGVRGLISQMASQPGPLRPPAMQVLAELTALEGNTNLALTKLDQLATAYPGTGDAFFARLSSVHLLLVLGDLEAAEATLVASVPRDELDEQSIYLTEALVATLRPILEADARRGTAGISGLAAAAMDAGDGPMPAMVAYPNPARDLVAVSYTTPYAATVELDVFDLLGRIVLRAPGQQVDAGTATIQLDISQLGSGQYILRLTIGGRSSTRETIVQRLIVAR